MLNGVLTGIEGFKKLGLSELERYLKEESDLQFGNKSQVGFKFCNN
jgi:hypothetical protein